MAKKLMKTKQKYVILLLVLISVFIGPACLRNKGIKEIKPNIILIIADDLGYSDVGFNGSIDIKTPHLDHLAQNGVICSSAYVAHPFCGPSRAGMITGRYPHAFGSQYNLPANSEVLNEGIPLSEIFISDVLKKSGYHTGAIGKWHLGAVERFHPNKRGFDEFYGFLGGGHKYFPKEYKAAYEKQKNLGTKIIFDYLKPLEYNGKDVDDDTNYLTDELSNQAVKFVNKAAKKDDPFFLYLAYNAPHTPLEATEEDLAVFSNIKDKKRRTFAAMVYAVDRGVGKLVESLKENKQLENTLIVFLSDNGGDLKHAATNHPLTGSKGDTNEGGYRVPMFLHFPKILPMGKTYEHPVSALDFYPTFAHLAGAQIPKDKALDGKNIWKSLISGKSAREGEIIYAMRHREGFTDVGLRKDNWKALKTKQNKWQLFDIKNDISEKNDLSSQNPKVLKEMVAKGEKWSRTHIEPKWFDPDSLIVLWKDKQMAKFNGLFVVDK
jgi:arylsulfatase A-like enzyme